MLCPVHASSQDALACGASGEVGICDEVPRGLPVDQVPIRIGLVEDGSVAHALCIKRNGGLLAGLGVLILHSRIGPLVGDHALLAVTNRFRQSITSAWIFCIFCKKAQINGLGILYFFHF